MQASGLHRTPLAGGGPRWDRLVGGGNSIVRMPVAGNQMRMMLCMYMFWDM